MPYLLFVLPPSAADSSEEIIGTAALAAITFIVCIGERETVIKIRLTVRL